MLEIAAEHRVAFFGIADMSPVWETAGKLPARHFLNRIEHYPCAIAVGVCVDDRLCDALKTLPAGVAGSHPSQKPYTKDCYGTVWPLATRAAAKLREALLERGYNVDQPKNNRAIRGLPKLVARYAGLGWIGKSSLLITPQRGPRAWWEALLTDAPLEPTSDKPMERRCGTCTRCIDVCPVRAYQDVPFVETEPLSKRYDNRKCAAHRYGDREHRRSDSCALCVKVCPYGRLEGDLFDEPAHIAELEESV
jgi:ferredoxin